ncbi:MAG: hypothetical protein AABX54_03810 [Nanoarchaeota archaeon]
MSLLKKLGNVGGIGGALILSAAMLGAPEKAEAHHPYGVPVYSAPVFSRTVIGPRGGVRTRIYSPPVFAPAPRVIVHPHVFVRPQYYAPAPVYVYPEPVFTPAPIIIWR